MLAIELLGGRSYELLNPVASTYYSRCYCPVVLGDMGKAHSSQFIIIQGVPLGNTDSYHSLHPASRESYPTQYVMFK